MVVVFVALAVVLTDAFDNVYTFLLSSLLSLLLPLMLSWRWP